MIIIHRVLSQKRRERTNKKNKNKWEKQREGTMLLSFYHTCASKQHHDLHDRDSLMLSLSYTSGNFHYRTWLVYSNDGLPQNALGLREQASWMHTHLVSFVELSYIYSSSAPVAWQSLLLALTSIDGHLHSPLISRVDVRLSPFLSSPHNLHHHILFHLQCYVHRSRSCIA